MGNDGSTAMERNLFNLKFAAKELERSAKKCEKDAVGEKLKLKRAIEQGNMEGAQIYAENAIRNKNQVKCRDFFISWFSLCTLFSHLIGCLFSLSHCLLIEFLHFCFLSRISLMFLAASGDPRFKFWGLKIFRNSWGGIRIIKKRN